MCCWMVVVLDPSASRVSISPQAGQPTVLLLDPASQKAGQIPEPAGILMRAEKVPFCWDQVAAPLVVLNIWMPAPVYWQAWVPQVAPGVGVLPVCRTRLPLPSWATLEARYWVGLWLPQPEVQQLSWFHSGVGSPVLGPEPAGPLNSSSKVVGSVAGVTGLVRAEVVLLPMVLTAVTVNW